MDATGVNGKRREPKGWWDGKTPLQRNIIVGVITTGILAGLIVPLCMNSSNNNETDIQKQNGDQPEVSVIIIGSGPAGIAAAAQLLENNITNVIILEAENRTGGRIQSVHFIDSTIDLGAQWCHGEKGNVVYDLASKYNLLENDPYDYFSMYHSSQKYLDRAFVKQIFDIAFDIYLEPKNGAESSMGEYILQRFNKTINENYGNNLKKVTLAHEIVNSFQLFVLSEDGAFSWFDIAAEKVFEQIEGRLSLGWKGRGYKTILDVLTKKIPDPENELPVYENVLLNKDVVKVSVNDDSVEVACSDKTTYTANHVIWTPSLGVLKHRYRSVFEPQLSKEKAHAIETLGIAAVMKVFLYFPQKWWPEHVDTFGFIWSKRDAQNVWKEFPYGSKTQGKSWLVAIQSIMVNRYNPNVLSVWFCGEAVPSIEKFHDDIIVNGTMFLLQKFMGHQYHNFTWPQKVIREKWYSNDHFRGTYSFETLESRADGIFQREILTAPLKSIDGKPSLMFAGEATHPTHFGTVHGAIETGQREAERIINYYKET